MSRFLPLIEKHNIFHRLRCAEHLCHVAGSVTKVSGSGQKQNWSSLKLVSLLQKWIKRNLKNVNCIWVVKFVVVFFLPKFFQKCWCLSVLEMRFSHVKIQSVWWVLSLTGFLLFSCTSGSLFPDEHACSRCAELSPLYFNSNTATSNFSFYLTNFYSVVALISCCP